MLGRVVKPIFTNLCPGQPLRVVAEIEGVIGLKAITPCATVLQCSASLAKALGFQMHVHGCATVAVGPEVYDSS